MQERMQLRFHASEQTRNPWYSVGGVQQLDHTTNISIIPCLTAYVQRVAVYSSTKSYVEHALRAGMGYVGVGL